MVTYLVVGLVQGAVYGLLALGLVLVYKGTRAFNFAQGEFGTVAAFAAWGLLVKAELPYGLALLGGLVAAVALGLLVERVLVRPLANAPRIALLVGTAGVALLAISLTALIAKPEPRVFPPAMSGRPLNLGGAAVSQHDFLVLGALAVAALALTLFFSRTNLGLAVLATSQDTFATRVVGVNVATMSRFIWGLAALLGGVAGLLQAPMAIVTPGFMTIQTLVPAFAAAVLGGMTSLPGAFVGGLVIGVAQNLGGYVLGQQLHVTGAGELTVFALLLVVLLIRARGLDGKGGLAWRPSVNRFR